MSTHGHLTVLSPVIASVQQLVRWEPSRPIATSAGELYLSQSAHGRMDAADDARNGLRETARAAFDQFLELGAAAHFLFDDSFGKLGVAQLKVLAPSPGTRLIGGFVDPILFVGLRLYWRDELPFKARKQVGVIDYKTLGAAVGDDWNALLPTIRRMPMKEFRDDS